MKFTPILGRVTAVVVLLGILVGTTPSFQPARAAPAGQEGTESWGEGQTPAPGHVKAVMSAQPPASARMQADAQPQQTASQTESAFHRGRVRDAERPVASQVAALAAPSSAQQLIPPAFSTNEIVWSDWTVEPARPILILLKRR